MRRTNRNATAVVLALLTAALGLTIHTDTANAQERPIDVDVRAGYYPDPEAMAVGAGVLANLGTNTGWYINPNVEFAMGNGSDIIALSGDMHYDFNQTRNTSVWVGGGPALLVENFDDADNETDLGLNLLTGIGARQGDIRPFAQLRGTMSDDSQIAITGGVRF